MIPSLRSSDSSPVPRATDRSHLNTHYLGELAAAGVRPHDVDTVVCTRVHGAPEAGAVDCCLLWIELGQKGLRGSSCESDVCGVPLIST